ncbi:MAG TPA: DUF29 domain-containing protein [Acetobacteraceae bacterium]|jgi:hypothetical protein
MDRGYDDDLAVWAESQARALRDAGHAGTNLPIDWDNVAEEIESLGRSQGRELASRIRTILLHLMKLQGSPAVEPGAGWRETIQEQRSEIEAVLADSPSLRPTISSVIDRELDKAKRSAELALAGYGEQPRVDLRNLRYTAEQVMGDWFPDVA